MKNVFLLLLVIFSVSVYGQNSSPSVSAGKNVTITLPVTSVQLTGSACDADGSISTYTWSKGSGAIGTLSTPTSVSTVVTGLNKAGTYSYKLTVKDNSGSTASSTVTITVKAANNVAPKASAGSDKTITLPTNSVQLAGSGTDSDGKIVSYSWVMESGGGGVIVSPSSATTNVTGLLVGSYRFRLTVTDDGGLTGSDTVHVTVNADPNAGGGSGGGTTPPPDQTGYVLTYQNGFDTNADLDPDGHGQIGGGSLSTNFFLTGPGCFKSVPSNVSAGIRSEVQFDDTRTTNEGVIEYDAYYEVVFQDNGHDFQWHPNTSGGSASYGLWHMGGQWVVVNWKGGTNTYYPTGITIKTGHWYHFRHEYKFGSAGYIHLYIDGQPALIKDNIQVGDGSGQYLKIGVNMWQSQTSVVYYDNLKIYAKQ